MRLRASVLFALLLTLAACSGAAGTPPTAIPNNLPAQAAAGAGGGYQVLLAQTITIIGSNRFAVALLQDNRLVKGAKLTLTFYDLTGKSGPVEQPIASLPAVYRESPDGLAGIYTVQATFKNSGEWGMDIKGTTADGKAIDKQAGFTVVVASTDLNVGNKAPAVKTPTLTSAGGDLTKLTSAAKPNPAFYKLSLDEAIESGKPTVVQFSTPAFCTSRLCGPVYDVVNQVYPAYADRANFVHVEVYKDLPHPNLQKPSYADAMRAWGLSTEPWTYVLDKGGKVAWRAEGLIGADELQAVLDNLLKS